MFYGYARISTAAQSLKRQIDNILSFAPAAVIYQESYTGTGAAEKRPEFAKLLKRVLPGDCIIFDEISRMSRDAASGFTLYQELFSKGVELIFLKERMLDTANFRQVQQLALTGEEIADIYIQATNKVLMLLAERQIRAAFESAQREVDMLHKRTADGMRAAGASEKISAAKKGKTMTTKKSVIIKAQIRQLSKEFDGKLSDAEILRQKYVHCTRNSYYKYKAQLRTELEEQKTN